MKEQLDKVDRFSLRFYADDAIEKQIVETLKSLPSGRRQELMRGWLKQGFMMLNQITCPAPAVISKTVAQEQSSSIIDLQEQGEIEVQSEGEIEKNEAVLVGDETDEDDLIAKMKSLTGHSE